MTQHALTSGHASGSHLGASTIVCRALARAAARQADNQPAVVGQYWSRRRPWTSMRWVRTPHACPCRSHGSVVAAVATLGVMRPVLEAELEPQRRPQPSADLHRHQPGEAHGPWLESGGTVDPDGNLSWHPRTPSPPCGQGSDPLPTPRRISRTAHGDRRAFGINEGWVGRRAPGCCRRASVARRVPGRSRPRPGRSGPALCGR